MPPLVRGSETKEEFTVTIMQCEPKAAQRAFGSSVEARQQGGRSHEWLQYGNLFRPCAGTSLPGCRRGRETLSPPEHQEIVLGPADLVRGEFSSHCIKRTILVNGGGAAMLNQRCAGAETEGL